MGSSFSIARTFVGHGGSGGSGGAGGNWIDVKSNGALGNGTLLFDPGLAITSGTNILTSTETPWTLSDVGETILVAGAGANGTDLWTTIASFTNSSTIVLAANAANTIPYATAVIGLAMWGGTDDTTAIQNTINAAVTQNLGVYFSPGVYIFSATFTLPAGGNPPFMFGESGTNFEIGGPGAYLVAQNPGIAPYVPFIQWDTQGNSCPMYQFAVIGGSYGNLGNSPTAGSLFQLTTEDSVINNLSIYNNSFQLGFDLAISGGTIFGLFDASQMRSQFDSTDLLDCSAASFVISGDLDSGQAGGSMHSCVASGGWPATALFHADSNFVGNSSVTMQSCSGLGNGTVEIGFDLRRGLMQAINCNIGGCQIGYWLGNYAKIEHCVLSPEGIANTLADFVISVTEVPFNPLTAYFLNQEVIDSNGNYQKVTTAGTTGASVPTWNTALGGTTTSGTVTFTFIANPANSPVIGAVLENCNNTLTAESPGPAPFGLYDLGTGTALNQNTLSGTISTTAPQYLQANTWVRVTANYTTLKTDEMIFANGAGTQTITLVTTNKVPGTKQQVKMEGTGYVNVIPQAGLIDTYSEVQLTIQGMSMDFGWDGSNHFIMAVYIPSNPANQLQLIETLQQIIFELKQLRYDVENTIDDTGPQITLEDDAETSLTGPV